MRLAPSGTDGCRHRGGTHYIELEDEGGPSHMLTRNHITRRPVRQAMKITRSALNHALDAAEPKLESAVGDLEDLSRDALKALRKSSLERLDDIRGVYGRVEKRVRKQLPAVPMSRRVGKFALIAAGLVLVSVALFR
jgi:hypothetical protein